MAEENTQDMAMEDILSSIKNILEEDQINNQPVAEPIAVADEVDDILELSQDMRLPEADVLAQEINLDVELDDMKIPELDISDNTFVDDNVSSLIKQDDFTTDPFVENDIENNENSISDLLNETETNFVEELSVPQPHPTEITLPEEQQTESFANDFQETTTSIVSETTDNIFSQENIVEDVVFEQPTQAEESPVEDTFVTPTIEKSPDENINTEVQTVESNENAVDASANIISNFAKMFAKEEAAIQQNKITIPENNINLLGDGSKTIEDIVCSVIRQIIADEVSTNWHKSADYENFAKQEISLYTQKWIDKNLPTIVEKIVKQEIERVMAKAGNNQ